MTAAASFRAGGPAQDDSGQDQYQSAQLLNGQQLGSAHPGGDVDVRQVLAEAVGECGRPTVAAAPDAQLPDGTYEGEGAGLEFGLSAGAEDGRAGRVRAGQRAGADGSRCGRAEVGEVVFVLPYGGDGAGRRVEERDEPSAFGQAACPFPGKQLAILTRKWRPRAGGRP